MFVLTVIWVYFAVCIYMLGVCNCFMSFNLQKFFLIHYKLDIRLCKLLHHFFCSVLRILWRINWMDNCFATEKKIVYPLSRSTMVIIGGLSVLYVPLPRLFNALRLGSFFFYSFIAWMNVQFHPFQFFLVVWGILCCFLGIVWSFVLIGLSSPHLCPNSSDKSFYTLFI